MTQSVDPQLLLDELLEGLCTETRIMLQVLVVELLDALCIEHHMLLLELGELVHLLLSRQLLLDHLKSLLIGALLLQLLEQLLHLNGLLLGRLFVRVCHAQLLHYLLELLWANVVLVELLLRLLHG